MTISKAFIQLLDFVKQEDVLINNCKESFNHGWLATNLYSSFEDIQCKHHVAIRNFIDIVTGNNNYTVADLCEKMEQTGKLCGIGEASIEDYYTVDKALNNYKTLEEKVTALIQVLKPSEDYYHKMLATHLVRNYVQDFEQYGAVPVKKYVPVEELLKVAESINPEKLVFSSMIMDKATQKYRELHDNLFIVYLTELKELVYSLLGLRGEFLTLEELKEFDKNFVEISNAIILTESFEFRGIVFEPNKETNQIEITLPSDILEEVKDIKPFIITYHHQYY